MTEISIGELKSLMSDNPDINLIDVREPEEHTEFNFGGKLFPLGRILSFDLDDIEHLKSEPVYIYCRSGKRSLQACMVLEQAGFENVVNIAGGALAWQEQSA